jgi:hypothetical protein
LQFFNAGTETPGYPIKCVRRIVNSSDQLGVPASRRWIEDILVHLTVVGICPPTVAVSVLIAALVSVWLLHRSSIP